MRSAIVEMLKDDFKSIYEAKNGAEAISATESHFGMLESGIVLLDIMLPDMSGIEVLEEAKKVSPDTVRILLTGFADVELAQEAINYCSIYKLLFKPWNDQELKETINSAIDLFKYAKEKSRLVTESQLLNRQSLGLTELNVSLQDHMEKGKLRMQSLTPQTSIEGKP